MKLFFHFLAHVLHFMSLNQNWLQNTKFASITWFVCLEYHGILSSFALKTEIDFGAKLAKDFGKWDVLQTCWLLYKFNSYLNSCLYWFIIFIFLQLYFFTISISARAPEILEIKSMHQNSWMQKLKN